MKMVELLSLKRYIYTLKGKKVRLKERWLVDVGFHRPFRQYFSLYRVVSQRQGERKREMLDERKNSRTTPIPTDCKHTRPLPFYHPTLI